MATTYDKASLVMIPSGVKESKLYSIKPTDGSGDFTFSRGTDTATRVNASGLIEKERGNLILQSNTFDTTWGPSSSISVTGGQSGYDGSSDAWLLKRSDASARYINQNITLGSSVYTYSVYAKAESESWIYIWSYDGTGSINAYFDLSGSGAVGTTSGVIDADIESIGSGWFRCSITYSNNISSVRLYPAVADGSITGGIVGAGIYIQDSQIEQGLVATDYIETTTAAVYEGITDNLPRLDYSGGASCPSLLLEPSRTNADPNSEYLANKPIVTNVSVTTNSTTSPEGVVNASTITNNTTSGQHQLTDNTFSVTSGTDYTISLFLKYNDAQYVRLQFGGTPFGSTNWQNFDVLNGTKGSNGGGITSADASIEDYGNGWYRCILTADATATGSNGAFQIRILEDDNTSDVPSFAGTGLSTYAYGAQLEEGSYPTSYIPTYGTSASRADDDMETGTLPAISGGEVSFFLDIDGAYDPNTNSTSANFQWYFTSGHWVTWNNNTSSDHRIRVTDSGGNEYFTLPANRTERCKVVVLLSSTNVKVISNGVIVGSRTILADWSTTNRLSTAITSAVGVVPIKQCLLFPTRLTDAEAIALTTI